MLYGATWQFKNWTAAVQACKDKGLQIAFPRNKAENAQLLHDIKASFTTHPNARKYSHENWVRFSWTLVSSSFFLWLGISPSLKIKS